MSKSAARRDRVFRHQSGHKELRLRRRLRVGKLGAHDFSFNMSDNLLQEFQFMRCGMALATLSFAAISVWGKAIDEPSEPTSGVEESDFIVSEKNEVELVEDSNISEAIQRRPDLTFSNVTIDGEGSLQSLDSISADDVTSVEVMKAVTPDQDADSRGGSIRLKTRPSYTQKEISTKIMLESEYNSYIEELGYEGSISVGGPLNGAATIGGRLTFSYEDEPEGNQYINKDWFRRTVNGESKLLLRELKLNDIREWNSDRDITASLDFKGSESLRLFWKGSHSINRNRERRPQLEYRFNEGKYAAKNSDQIIIEGFEVERGLYEFENEIEIAETTLGSEWESGNWEADVKFLYQIENYKPIDYFNVDFVKPDVDAAYELDSYLFPLVMIENGDSIDDSSQFALEDFAIRDRNRDERDAIGSVNVRLKNAFDNESLSLRFGVKSRRRDYDTFGETAYFSASSELPLSLADAELRNNGISLISDRYRYGPAVDRTKIESLIEDNFQSFPYEERRSREITDSSTFSVEENIDAIYAMGDYSVGNWRALVGLRQEITSIDFESNEVIVGNDVLDKDSDGNTNEIVYLGTSPTFGSNQYNNFFPNTHLRFRLNNYTTFITSYTETIDRPRYADVVPYRLLKLEDQEVEEGNPNLRPTLYANIDISVDMKVKDGGLVSFEFFDRQVEDYIFSNETIISGGIYDGFELERQENGSSAFLRGVSMTWNQPISLPFFDEGFSLNAKYVKQESELQYPERPGEVLPLPMMPDNEMNVSFTYEKERLFAQLKFWNEEDKVFRVGKDTESDRYLGSKSSVDLSVSYKLKEKARVYVEWDNITNEPYGRIYEGSPLYATYYRTRPWTLTTGMRIEL